MKKLVPLAVVLLFFSGLANQAVAQKSLPGINRKALMDSMTPEQRKAFRKNLRARYDSLSPEQKEKFRERLLRRGDSTLTPQQKNRLRKRLQNMPSAGNG